VAKLLVALYVIATSLALIVLKLGTKTGAPINYVHNKVQVNFNALVVSGILFYGISFFIYVYLISRYDLGYIIPLTAALIYIIIFTASYLIFDEAFTITKILGITLIVVGLVFLNFKS
jgi:drug/metabolite transporter (DMT)-like permease